MAAKKTRSSKSKPRRSKAPGATVAAGPRKDAVHRRAAAPKTSALPRAAPRAATPELRAEQPSVHHALLSEVARGTDAHSVERAPKGLLARAWSGARSLVLRALCFA